MRLCNQYNRDQTHLALDHFLYQYERISYQLWNQLLSAILSMNKTRKSLVAIQNSVKRSIRRPASENTLAAALGDDGDRGPLSCRDHCPASRRNIQPRRTRRSLCARDPDRGAGDHAHERRDRARSRPDQLPQAAPAQGKVGVDPGRDFADHARPDHQPVADDLRVSRHLSDGVEKKTAPSHGLISSCV